MRPGAAPLAAEPIAAQFAPVSGVVWYLPTMSASGATAGQMAVQPQPIFSGSMTPAAVLPRQVRVTFAGVSAAAGRVGRQAQVTVSASIAPTGLRWHGLQQLCERTSSLFATPSDGLGRPIASAPLMALWQYAPLFTVHGFLGRTVARITRYRALDASVPYVALVDTSAPVVAAVDESHVLLGSVDATQGDAP